MSSIASLPGSILHFPKNIGDWSLGIRPHDYKIVFFPLTVEW